MAVDWNKLAAAVADQGRNGDSMLAHVTPEEAQLLKDRGGAGTINPKTGLYEFYDDPGSAGAQMGPAGSGNQGSVSNDSGSTASPDTSSPGFLDKITGMLSPGGSGWFGGWGANPVPNAMAGVAGLLGGGLPIAIGKGLSSLTAALGANNNNMLSPETQALAMGPQMQGAGSANNSSGNITQPLPDTSTIGTAAPATAVAGQDTSGLNPSHGLPPSVLDYLARIGVLAL
jgi:hypothetical protein